MQYFHNQKHWIKNYSASAKKKKTKQKTGTLNLQRTLSGVKNTISKLFINKQSGDGEV